MNLNERKIKILEAIIKDYIQSGDPISSRTIAKKYNLGVSSATIRNEMSDLEELGLIIQRHTSSGRVPSNKGYRIYVDNFMEKPTLSSYESNFLKNVINNNINRLDYLMEETAKALSLLTNYTSIISQPKSVLTNIERVQLLVYDEKSVAVTLITSDKEIKNIVVNTNKQYQDDELYTISNILSQIFKQNSLSFVKANLDNFAKHNHEFQPFISLLLSEIVDFFYKEQDIKLYTSGFNNMLNFPEFSDAQKAKPLFKTLEEKDILINLLDISNSDTNSINNSIQISIGTENYIEQFKDCSIIKTEFKIKNAVGNIGIIAPTRMDYAKTVSILNSFIKYVNDVIKGSSP